QSACKMGSSACKGQNACKGQGSSVTGTAPECTAAGGEPLQWRLTRSEGRRVGTEFSRCEGPGERPGLGRVRQGRSWMSKKASVSTAAALFAAGALVTAAHAQGTNRCYGVNACKGQSACKSTRTSCKGQNACKGQGISVTGTALECTAAGGVPTP